MAMPDQLLCGLHARAVGAGAGNRPAVENIRAQIMTRFYQPDLSENVDSPFVQDGANKLVRRSYWLDMDDRTLVMVMVTAEAKI